MASNSKSKQTFLGIIILLLVFAQIISAETNEVDYLTEELIQSNEQISTNNEEKPLQNDVHEDILQLKNGWIIKGNITKIETNMIHINTTTGLKQISLDMVKGIALDGIDSSSIYSHITIQTQVLTDVKFIPVKIKPAQVAKPLPIIKKTRIIKSPFFRSGQIGIYTMGCLSYMDMSDVNSFNSSMDNSYDSSIDLSLDFSWGWEAGVRFWFNPFFAIESGYGQSRSDDKVKVYEKGKYIGKLIEEMYFSYFPINLLYNRKIGKIYFQIGGGISIYNGVLYFYDGMVGSYYNRYIEAEGNCVGINLLSRVEFILIKNITLSAGFYGRIATTFKELKDTTYKKKLKIHEFSYGKDIFLSDSDKYNNFIISLNGIRMILGLNFYLNLI